MDQHMPYFSAYALCALVVLASHGLSAQTPDSSRSHQVTCIPPTADPTCPENFAFQSNGPVAFLAFLRTARTPFSVAGIHKGWLRPSDVPALLDRVGSNDPCALVVMASASYAPLKRSTIGQEALFLLDGIRTGAYPPTLHSHAYDAKHRNEILRWARQQPR